MTGTLWGAVGAAHLGPCGTDQHPTTACCPICPITESVIQVTSLGTHYMVFLAVPTNQRHPQTVPWHPGDLCSQQGCCWLER